KILLTGYRATGKTTIGKEVARRLDFAFLDTDREIEKKVGKTISQIVSEHGWQYFREQEKLLLDQLAAEKNLVIAAGGGAVMHHKSWQRLRQRGYTVWLTASTDTICYRLARDKSNKDQRPSLTDKDFIEEVESVLNQRRGLYEDGSDLQISSEQDIGTVADEIIRNYELGIKRASALFNS
ncbi:MAG: shikimate kinase, partial [Thermodesulfobacteriota bacterium]